MVVRFVPIHVRLASSADGERRFDGENSGRIHPNMPKGLKFPSGGRRVRVACVSQGEHWMSGWPPDLAKRALANRTVCLQNNIHDA